MSASPTSLDYTYHAPEVVQGTTTSWLPVTTAFPSVAGCDSAFFLFPGQPFPVAYDPGYGYFAGGTLRCLPPAATSWHEQEHQAPDGYTSLSIRPIVCPQAFTTAVTEVRDVSSTLVMCCPSGYDLRGGQPGRVTGACQSTLTSGQVISYTASDPLSNWITTKTTVTSSQYMNAVAMRGWNVGSSTTSSSGSASRTSTGSPQSSSVSGTGKPSSGLSTGAKAGIGVGVALGVVGLLCLLAAVFLVKRKSKRQKGPPPEIGTPHGVNDGVIHEMRTKEKPSGYY
ncbi:hypothetical protein EJ08DRAFT_125819 [Tothia fuscella]|uniref:Uncharacterized protein n=1 Tax=Tothia fuscella TaxID=1048955 RepID=A0A9P4NUR6_9PEZI|nr:hypothetical protein EJ08DRAFT_125819 [Tothia fuscella]